MSVKYQDLLEAVSRETGIGSRAARAAAEATVAALARTLDQPERDHFMDVLPDELKVDLPSGEPKRRWDQGEFVQAVSERNGQPPEESRLRAQAVLARLAEQDPALPDELHLSAELRELFVPPAAGGGVTGPTGRAAPLTAGEVAAALAALPEWTGDTRELRRTVVLSPGDLDRLLERVRRIRVEAGHGAQIRRSADTVELTVRTASIDAVTDTDIDLAFRLNELIDEIAPGMNSP